MTLELRRLNFESLMIEAEAAGREGLCPFCEDSAFEACEQPRAVLLCWCGVCFRNCHDYYFHEDGAFLSNYGEMP